MISRRVNYFSMGKKAALENWPFEECQDFLLGCNFQQRTFFERGKQETLKEREQNEQRKSMQL